MPTPLAAAIMVLAGLGVPVLAAMNAALGRQIGSPAVAACVLFALGLAISAGVALATGTEAAARIAQAPRWQLAGGVFVAFYVLSITWIAPGFGIGNAVFCVLFGQIISSAAIDHFGLFTARPEPLSAMRMAGIAVMGLGVALTQVAQR